MLFSDTVNAAWKEYFLCAKNPALGLPCPETGVPVITSVLWTRASCPTCLSSVLQDRGGRTSTMDITLLLGNISGATGGSAGGDQCLWP